MKFLLSLTILFTFSSNLIAQRNHKRQSTPFENALKALQSDSASLFMNSFSERITKGKTSEKYWGTKLQEGKAKFKKRFGDYKLGDFTYKYDRKESKLIIYFREKEEIRLRVIKEKGTWKLDEK